MKAADKPQFMKVLTDVMAFYRQDVSPFALSVWWQAAQPFDLEQVSKALTAHALDPDRGQFAPKPADLVRQLQGTSTDRSLMAWAKVYDAIRQVGAYSSVCFDAPVIHAVVDDLGGWVRLCRSETSEIQFVQKRFCDAYKAYAGRTDITFPSKLLGAHDLENAKVGFKSQMPVLIGNPEAAREVLRLGAAGPKTQVTQVGALVPALLSRKVEA